LLDARFAWTLSQLPFLFFPVFLGDWDRFSGIEPFEQQGVDPFLTEFPPVGLAIASFAN